MIEEVEQVVLPSSPEDRKAILEMFQEVSGFKVQIEARNVMIKEAIKAASEKFEIKAKHLTKWANAFHKQSFEKQAAESDTMEAVKILIVGDAIPGAGTNKKNTEE